MIVKRRVTGHHIEILHCDKCKCEMKYDKSLMTYPVKFKYICTACGNTMTSTDIFPKHTYSYGPSDDAPTGEETTSLHKSNIKLIDFINILDGYQIIFIIRDNTTVFKGMVKDFYTNIDLDNCFIDSIHDTSYTGETLAIELVDGGDAT